MRPPVRAALRTTISLLSLGVALLAPARRVAAQATEDQTIKRETLGEGIYLFRAPSSLDKWTATNVVVIVNDQDVTVFDSNTRAVTARMVIAEIRKLTSKPVRTLINSHWHMDDWSGNNEYTKAFPGVQIISTTETRDYMKRMAATFFADGLANSVTRSRATLDTAVRTGKRRDGTPFTDAMRREMEADIAETAAFHAEVAALPRVLPNLVYRDSLIFWSGRREFRLISVTGDATGSTVMYLPTEKLLVMGDVLVGPEEGAGPPPWTTNSYAITPWLTSLRSLEALDASVIVPGQGPAFRDKAFLKTTVDLFAAIITQVHSAMERGVIKLADVQAAVNVDDIGRRYVSGAAPGPAFQTLVAALVRKVSQESLDGVVK